MSFDVVWLLEIKTSAKITVPGFCVFQNSDPANPKRGGVAMLIKHRFVQYIVKVDTSSSGQIWLTMSLTPDLVL